MWRSSLTLAARPQRHLRQFRTRRNQWDGARKAIETPTFKPNVARNLAFAAGSSCLFFTGGAVYMYEYHPFGVGEETLTEQPPHRKRRSRQSPWKDWWTSLPSYKKNFFVIFGANALVYSIWKLPSLSPFMTKFFVRSPKSTRVTPMLLSVFSHKSFPYLSLNMLTLLFYIGPATQILGETQFCVLYLTAGVCSSVASHFLKCFLRIPTISMGAGGAVVGLWTLVALVAPDARVNLVISSLPPLSITLSDALEISILVDVLGVILSHKSRTIDHAARLAGVLLSIVYFGVGHKFHQWYTDEVVELWHQFREGGSD